VPSQVRVTVAVDVLETSPVLSAPRSDAKPRLPSMSVNTGVHAPSIAAEPTVRW
jgi:hypothetical protein